MKSTAKVMGWLIVPAMLAQAEGCSGGLGSIPGTYTVSAVTCGTTNTAPTNGGIANWITPPSELTFNLAASGTSTEVFNNGSCSITLSFTTATQANGTLTLQGTGTYVCTGNCSTYAVSNFGSNLCAANNTTNTTFLMTPPLGVASQEQLILAAQSPDTTCSSYGNTDPVTYTLVKN